MNLAITIDVLDSAVCREVTSLTVALNSYQQTILFPPLLVPADDRSMHRRPTAECHEGPAATLR